MLISCLIAQFIGFSLMWWTPQPYEGLKGRWRAVWPTATQTAKSQPAEPMFGGTDETRRLNVRDQWAMTYTMAVPLTQLASLVAVFSQTT